MSGTTIKAVCVWLDNQSGAEYPVKWIVSKDELDGMGRAETSRTISTHDSEEEAIEAGRAEAAKRRLPLYRNPERGPAKLLQGTADTDGE